MVMVEGLRWVVLSVVILVVSSVTMCPWVAAEQYQDREEVQSTYTEELTAMVTKGPVDLAGLSKLSVIQDAGIKGIDVVVEGNGVVNLAPPQQHGEGLVTGAVAKSAVPLTVREGLFTVTERPKPRDGRGGVRAERGQDTAYEAGLVANLSRVGYDLRGKTTQAYETTIRGEKLAALDPSRLEAVGMRKASDGSAAVVSQGVVSRYEFVNRTTGDPLVVTATQPMTSPDISVGTMVVAVVGDVAGVVAIVALMGPGISIVAAAAIVVVVILAVVLVALILHDMSPAAEFRTTGTDPPYYLAVSDGMVVRDNGSVQCYLGATIPALPQTGSGWVQATRKAAITAHGDLWMLTTAKTGKSWTKYDSPTGHRYVAISETGKWVAAVAIDDQGKTSLEIPPGKGQPPVDSQIGKDVATLNAGKDPHHENTVIDPPVPAWRSFIAGSDFGLALTTDGRVFGVGSNNDHQCDLPNRYTKLATHGHTGKRYSVGIRADTGTIDFAGNDRFHIAKDIAAAHLVHVIDIAAGPDRAIAITQHGGIKVFGKQSRWKAAPSQSFEGNFTAISASTIPHGPTLFVAGQEPGSEIHLTSSFKLVPPSHTRGTSSSSDPPSITYGTTITHYANGVTRVTQPNAHTHWINDAEVPVVTVPTAMSADASSSSTRASHVVEVPSGSRIVETSPTSSVIYSPSHEQILTISTTTESAPTRRTAPTSQTTTTNKQTKSKSATNLTSSECSATWAAFANASIDKDTLGEYSAHITVPTAPTRTENADRKLAMFISVSPKQGDGIFQPVLGFRWKDNYNDTDPGCIYTLSVWDLANENDAIHTSQTGSVSVGDTIENTIKWKDNSWYGEIKKSGSDSLKRTLTATKFKNTDVTIDAVLEGYGCVGTSTLPGQVHFDQIFVKDRKGTTITPAFAGFINGAGGWTSNLYPDLDVTIRNSNDITIATGNT